MECMECMECMEWEGKASSCPEVRRPAYSGDLQAFEEKDCTGTEIVCRAEQWDMRYFGMLTTPRYACIEVFSF